MKATPEELVLASSHEGKCRACHVDMQRQIEAQGGVEDGIVPRRSYLNSMNPWYGFLGGQSGRDLRALFASATVLEAMLVALEHMQVHFVLARRTRLPKFVKNVSISVAVAQAAALVATTPARGTRVIELLH